MDFSRWWALLRNPEALRTWVEGFGALGPLVFIFLQALQVVFAPLPGEITGFVAGYLFGAFWGFLYAMVGIVIGASVAFGLARKFRKIMAPRLSRSPYFRRLERFMQRRGLLAAFICYLFPGFPKDYLNYFLGLFPIPFKVFLILMTVGRVPGTLALAIQGDSLYERDWFTFTLLGGLSLALFLIFYLKREAFYQYLGNDSSRVS